VTPCSAAAVLRAFAFWAIAATRFWLDHHHAQQYGDHPYTQNDRENKSFF
jgi:hypothetical protein